ncbi:MAG: STAS domain-containing protein, partial [Desulfobacteraceae bacterium]|nr:STAS domain-containing protein [Desulfobacteraceae bacterium]
EIFLSIPSHYSSTPILQHSRNLKAGFWPPFRGQIKATSSGRGFFTDSSGLGSLVSSLRSLNKLGGDIKIASLQDQVRAIFELTRLHRVFQVFDEREEAVKSF